MGRRARLSPNGVYMHPDLVSCIECLFVGMHFCIYMHLLLFTRFSFCIFFSIHIVIVVVVCCICFVVVFFLFACFSFVRASLHTTLLCVLVRAICVLIQLILFYILK